MNNDYTFWMVVNPAKFLPLMIVVLVASVLIVHLAVITSGDKYDFLNSSFEVAAAE